jgi:cobalt/nickel transport system ATP-binding protein
MQNVDEQILAPTVWDDVSFSPRNYGYSAAQVEKMVSATLAQVGIAHLRDKVCHHLSGGEKRKVALAGQCWSQSARTGRPFEINPPRAVRCSTC